MGAIYSMTNDATDDGKSKQGGDEWKCRHCGEDCWSEHIVEYDPDLYENGHLLEDLSPEVKTIVTCEDIHFRPIGGGHGFVFKHNEFENIIEHFKQIVGGDDVGSSQWTEADKAATIECEKCGDLIGITMRYCPWCGDKITHSTPEVSEACHPVRGEDSD